MVEKNLANGAKADNANVFAKRAASLSKLESEEQLTVGQHFIVFCLGCQIEERYAFEYEFIEKVIPMQKVTALPDLPKYFLGVTYYNAEIFPVIDTNFLLGIDNSSDEYYKHLLILRSGDYNYALAVQEIVGHKVLDLQSRQDFSELEVDARKFTLGIFAAEIGVLDAKRIFNSVNREL